ncbi:MAG: TlpA family protein disulfide reductase [Ilumatobacter sp.]
MTTSSIDEAALEPAGARQRPRFGLRRSMAGLAIAGLLVSACGSGDDTVSSDGVSSESAESDGVSNESAESEETQTVDTAAEPDEATASDAGSGAVEAEPAGLQENGPVVVTGAALDPFDATIADSSVGQAAPVIEGESFDGTPITLGGPTENATLVVFLAHWCPHCREEVPVLVELEASGRLPADLDVVGVSTAVAADRDNYPPSQWLEDGDWPWPALADDEVLGAINAMGGTSFPFAVVLDTDGNVLARKGGQSSADDTIEFLEAALA